MDTEGGEGDKELGGRMQEGIRMLLSGPSGRCRGSENPQGLFPLCSTSAISAGTLSQALFLCFSDDVTEVQI